MAHPDEVLDHLKDSDHTIPKDDWENVRALAANYAQEAPEAEDALDVPEPEADDWADDDPDSENRDNSTPDHLTRKETL